MSPWYNLVKKQNGNLNCGKQVYRQNNMSNCHKVIMLCIH